MPSTKINSYKPTGRYRSPCRNLDYFRVDHTPGTLGCMRYLGLTVGSDPKIETMRFSTAVLELR